MHFYPFENVREVNFWGEGERGLDIIYWTTALCEMWSMDGVVKKNKSCCDCNIAARCSAMLFKPQIFTNTKPSFRKLRPLPICTLLAFSVENSKIALAIKY